MREQRARVLSRMLGPGAPRALVTVLGRRAFEEGILDLFGMLQSPTFVSQILLSLLEATIVVLFPELAFLVKDAKMGVFY